MGDLVGGRPRVRADHPDAQRVGLRDRSASAERGCDRNPGFGAQSSQPSSCPGLDHASAGEDQWTLSVAQSVEDRAQNFGLRFGWRVDREWRHWWERSHETIELAFLALKLEVHRAGIPGGCDPERSVKKLGHRCWIDRGPVELGVVRERGQVVNRLI